LTARLWGFFFEVCEEARGSVNMYATSNRNANLGCRANIKTWLGPLPLDAG
jgi:hypothetical protein